MIRKGMRGSNSRAKRDGGRCFECMLLISGPHLYVCFDRYCCHTMVHGPTHPLTAFQRVGVLNNGVTAVAIKADIKLRSTCCQPLIRSMRAWHQPPSPPFALGQLPIMLFLVLALLGKQLNATSRPQLYICFVGYYFYTMVQNTQSLKSTQHMHKNILSGSQAIGLAVGTLCQLLAAGIQKDAELVQGIISILCHMLAVGKRGTVPLPHH